MSKRQAQDEQNGGVSLKQGDRPATAHDDAEMGQFEDDFEDEFESEDEIMVAGADGLPDDEEDELANGSGRLNDTKLRQVIADNEQTRWKSINKPLYLAVTSSMLVKFLRPT